MYVRLSFQDPRGTATPIFWGKDSHGNVVFSSNWQIAKNASDKFYDSVTGGCFVESGKGLRSLVSPDSQRRVVEHKET